MPSLPRLTALFLACITLTTPALADEWRTISYEKLYKALSSVKPLEDAKYIHLQRRIATTAPDMTLGDIRMVIATKDGDIDVPIGEDGSLAFPMSEALLEEDPPVKVNVPEGQLSVTMQVQAGLPSAQQFPYSQVVELADEYGRFVKRQGMLARMMAPDVAGLEVSFSGGGPAGATLSAPANRTYAAGADGKLVIPLDSEWAGAEVALSRIPDQMRLTFED